MMETRVGDQAWQGWLSVPLMQRDQLPNAPGIYAIVDANHEVWYVGKSKNIQARWQGKTHHRFPALSRRNKKYDFQIYWYLCSVSELDQKEQLYIDQFKPHLNYSRVLTYARRARQPQEEISRLLKVINRKTQLFPDVRSVVLGQWVNIVDDEEGGLEEYLCFVIVVHTNDHDDIILKSCMKSQKRKGKSLQGYWKVYESDCGSSDKNVEPIKILVFLIDNIAYEFVSSYNTLTRLEQYQDMLHYVELAGQSVLALKDPGVIPSLDIHGAGAWSTRNEDYIVYRAEDLQPLEKSV